MSHPTLRWLLDLESIPADAEALLIGWEHAWPAWLWTLLILGVVGVCVIGYGRLTGPRWARTTLATLRGLLLITLLALLSGPMLVVPRERIEQDWLLVLLDRSASLTIADAPSPSGRRIEREEQMRRMLRDHRSLFDRLAEDRRVVWLGFDAGAYELSAAPEQSEMPVLLGEPVGLRTRIGPALEQALQRAAARPLAGVLLVSDGRTTDSPTRGAIRRLQAEDVPVHVVALGAREPIGDIAVRRVSSPARAFVRDQVPVTVEIDRVGAAAATMVATVRLVDSKTGAELDRIALEGGAEGIEEVTLVGTPAAAGEANWAVIVDTDIPDLVPENNRRELVVGLVDRPLRVLYVEGYPRWEYRYLKNLLVREESIESSVLLLSADRDFAQEGNTPLSRMPRTAEEFAPFDLMVVGDVPAGFFAPGQLAAIRDAVAERGMGLLWIGGPFSTPSSWGGSALADLLPIRAPLELPAVGEPVTMAATALAARLGVLQLGDDARWPEELADPATGWSRLRWAQRIDPMQLKPTAEVLAETAHGLSAQTLPLIVSMRFGAGQSVYIATDEIWRWRYGRGEMLPERFWLQTMRMLARDGLAGGERGLSLVAEPRRAMPGQPVRIVLRATDALVGESALASVRAVVQSTDRRGLGEIELRATGRGGEWSGAWLPDLLADGGQERIVRIDDPALALADDLSVAVEIVQPDEERRRPETDHELLRRLAEETGGQMLPADDLSALEQLRRRHVVTDDPIAERIWNTPLALILVLLLATLEWVGRRMLSYL